LLRRNISLENIIQFKKNKALLRRELKNAKRSSLQKFTAEINPNSSPSKIWANINTFCGRKTRNDIHCLTSPSDPPINIINSESIA